MKPMDYVNIFMFVFLITFAFFAADLLLATEVHGRGFIVSIEMSEEEQGVAVFKVSDEETNVELDVFCKNSILFNLKKIGDFVRYTRIVGRFTKINYLTICNR